MFARKRLDIDWSDLAVGMAACCQNGARREARRQLESFWAPGDQGMATYSVRTAFDLFLRSRDWDEGDQIVMSGKTIPKMIRLVEHHGLVPVPVDIDIDDLSLRIDRLREAITDRTRAIVAAHLYGSRMPLDPIVEVARDHDLRVIEDAAQAYRGPAFTGHPEADISMFSFGPIKTATALRGALSTVRDDELRAEMRECHREYPIQEQTSYLKRILSHSVLVGIGHRAPYTAFVGACRTADVSHEKVINHFVRSFRGDNFVDRLRYRPSEALYRLLYRRIADDDLERLRGRAEAGHFLLDRLADYVRVVGSAADNHTFWLFPVLAEDPDGLVDALQRRGFDATRGGTSLTYVATPDPDRFPPARQARMVDRHVVYLPVYPEMGESGLERMAHLVNRHTAVN